MPRYSSFLNDAVLARATGCKGRIPRNRQCAPARVWWTVVGILVDNDNQPYADHVFAGNAQDAIRHNHCSRGAGGIIAGVLRGKVHVHG